MKSAVSALLLFASLPTFLLSHGSDVKKRPLTEQELVYLLTNYVASARVAELATKRGLNFEITPDIERDLRQAGANSGLINVLKALIPKAGTFDVAQAPIRRPATQSQSALFDVGSTRVNPNDGAAYVWIPAGNFTIGCSPGDSECGSDEKPPHLITIPNGFWMGQMLVTVEAWKRYRIARGVAALPTTDIQTRQNWNEAGDQIRPAVAMTWDEAKSYCESASMRLPTEAEWEYAARAGTTSARYGDLNSIAWFGDNSGNERLDSAALWKQNQKTYLLDLFDNGNFVHAVGLKQPNAWKLYDVLGNVLQWTEESYQPAYLANAERENGLERLQGEGARVARGGAWSEPPSFLRVSRRRWLDHAFRDTALGCRCVGNLP